MVTSRETVVIARSTSDAFAFTVDLRNEPSDRRGQTRELGLENQPHTRHDLDRIERPLRLDVLNLKRVLEAG